jgi:NADPH:quinone reductase-like Zn-dependent oxidoreductase
LVRSLGADHVIDYTQQDFTQGAERYDLILDNVGNHSLSDARRVMKPESTWVMVGGPKTDPWIGPLSQPIKAMFLSPFVSEKFVMFIAQLNAEDLTILSDLASTGKLRTVIDKRYTLSEVPEAIAYLQTGRARGKVVINVTEGSDAVLMSEL